MKIRTQAWHASILLAVWPLSALAAAHDSLPGASQESKPPNVTVTQNGKVTSLTVAGQLAAKNPLGCVPLSSVDSTRTPPDVYQGASACILSDDYQSAVALFALAGMESRFDAERVADKSAGQAGPVLIMNTFNGMPQDKREKFGKTLTDLTGNRQALAQICGAIRKIGYPSYYPEYMVLHGIKAFTPKPGDPTLTPAFDATTTWNSLLTKYLSCPDEPTSVAAPAPATPAKRTISSSDPYGTKPGF